MSTASRAIYSIDPHLLSRFNAMFAPRERSKVVERLMQSVLDQREQALLEAAHRSQLGHGRRQPRLPRHR